MKLTNDEEMLCTFLLALVCSVAVGVIVHMRLGFWEVYLGIVPLAAWFVLWLYITFSKEEL